jgi:general secretion pathway protein M
MNEWWFSKTQQEQRAIIIGGVVVFILLLYVMVWLPFTKNLDKQVKNVQDQKVTLQWIQSNLDQVKKLRLTKRGTKTSSNEALLTLIERTAKNIQLRKQLQNIKPKGDNGVQLMVEQAPFDTLIRWLGQLTLNHGLEIESLNIDKQDSPGLVNARIVIERGGKG